jgi:hypothetical protein
MSSDPVVPSYAELFPELPTPSKPEEVPFVPVKPRTITEV